MQIWSYDFTDIQEFKNLDNLLGQVLFKMKSLKNVAIRL